MLLELICLHSPEEIRWDLVQFDNPWGNRWGLGAGKLKGGGSQALLLLFGLQKNKIHP